MCAARVAEGKPPACVDNCPAGALQFGKRSELLAEAREGLRSLGRSSEDADWQRAFDSGIVDLVRAGRVADAKELLNQCL